MAVGSPGERSLKETPTWAVALVCAVFVIVSVIIEYAIHSLGKWFNKRHKKALFEALEKIKAELMLLGFISLLLTVGTQYIVKICIPANLGHVMLPCKIEKKKGNDGGGGDDDNERRKLLSYAEDDILWRRALASAAKDDYCAKNGKVSLISYTGVHQLHIFIFVLAVFHVLYSVITIALARAKMKKWKAWELETSSFEYQFTNDPTRFRFTRQTSFVKRHSGISRIPGIRWIVAFFRQFFGSVTKVDYMTMRHGFINAHLAPNSKFDFRKYIKRSMEDDFKTVVGISIPLWTFAVIFLLLNVYQWYVLSWLTVVPLTILLLVGTKMELIIMEMAQEIQDRSTVVKGAPIVEPSNKYFWFNRPDWILLLIHFTLFQNAFEMANFLWTWYEFGLTSCFHENLPIILVARVFLGIALQILCSYITFPLYALITQMGSHMKQAIFEEQTARALKNWQKTARARKKQRKISVDASSSGFMSGENTPSQGASPLHLLHAQKHRSTQSDLESVINSPRSYQSDTDLSDLDSSTHDGHVTILQYQPPGNKEEPHSMDFSFVKP
ncbi:LOW QUALITY PROTEIN: MLO protein homolog 1 [Morus notabilis]|uniref:LOW QUALITY PROTEIN: MLO protein homolog 1 n=1 Tax=Morus notabilis TaxID=981085 RepID=UPI000CED6E55|nr:LOW QUALITY PROTEIN: MLO protein homolog 1 [Morus notabilis]